MPEPEIAVILAPLTLPVVAKEKLLVLSPVTEAPKVAVYCTVAAFVKLDDTSVIELIVVGAAVTVLLAVATFTLVAPALLNTILPE